MLKITIPFEGSWTNVFLDENKDALFTSGTSFNKGQGGAKVESIALQAGAAPNTSRVSNIRALNARNPGMTYQVPVNYDNTVKGVLARLMGEVRRLADLEVDHPVHAVFAACSYEMAVTAEHDEIISFATPPNPIQSGGAGVLPAGNPLYEGTALAKRVFGHLGGSLADLVSGRRTSAEWTPSSPSALVIRLQNLADEQAAYIKSFKAVQGDDYVSPFRRQGLEIQQFLAALPSPVSTRDDFDGWGWAGALIARAVYALDTEERERLQKDGFLSAAGNLQGLAMSGNLGNITIKDVYAGAGCQREFSSRMPYIAAFWFEGSPKKQKFELGIIKKSGVLQLNIELPSEQARAVQVQIEQAAVGPFHFGKKGIAYVERCYVI